MTAHRAWLAAMGGLALAAGGWVAGSYATALARARDRIATGSELVELAGARVEYAIAGQGRALLMLHGAGGGFDQALLFANRLRETAFRIIAPSRFGYLRSSLPEDASPAHQADVLASLLDHLQLDRVIVAAGSAGALSAAEFALRHPGRCSHLVLLVPAINLAGRDPVEFTALQRRLVERVLSSDAAFWTLASLAPRQLLRMLLATDPALLARVGADERQRVRQVIDALLPVSARAPGWRADAFWAGAPARTSFEQITVPTLILSCADDRFGTAATAGRLAARIPGARLTVYPSGGHLWLGHDGDVAAAIDAFTGEAGKA